MNLLKIYALTGTDNTEQRELKLDEFVQKEFTLKTYEAFQQLTNNWVEFNGVNTLDYDEGFYIENFSLPTGLKQGNAAVQINPSDLTFTEPNALFTYLEKEAVYLFFKVPGSANFPARTYQHTLSKAAMQKIFPPFINIKGKIACVYKDHTLYFTSYYDARQIFNLELYYEAAVKKEIAKLEKQPYFNKEDEMQWNDSLDFLLNGNVDDNEHYRISEKREFAVNQNNDEYSSSKQDDCSLETTNKSKNNHQE